MRKTLTVILAVVFILTQITTAFAAVTTEVTEFGFDQYRNRDGKVDGHIFHPLFYHDGGPSYSQPLILKGDRWGGALAGKYVAITVESNKLNGYILPDVPLAPPKIQRMEAIWSVQLSGSQPTKSHPTLLDKGEKKYVFIGTYSKYLDVLDVSDFNTVSQANLVSKENPYATDITSAPLVLNWKGHDVVIGTSGNTGKAFLMVDPTDSSNAVAFNLNCGSGRTSSSPAPIYDGQGFAVGLDATKGELQLYHLDDILAEDGSGKVYQKGNSARVVKETASGITASFSVDGNLIFFGDKQSNMYAFNWLTGKWGWGNSDHRGIFSNRSPALTPSRMYFPAVGDTKGKLIAVDRSAGTTDWTREFETKAQTAAMIFRVPIGAGIFEGTSGGMLVGLGPDGKDMFPPFQIADATGVDKYASGVAGEISAVGPYCVITTEQGVICWVLARAFNLQAVDITPTDEEVQPEKLVAGQTYTGTAMFKMVEDSDYTNCNVAPVGVFFNDQYTNLTDMDGNPLPKVQYNGSEFFVLENIERGKEYKVKFTYTLPTDGSAVITALINLNQTPVANIYMENTLEDNKVTEDFSLTPPNLMVDDFDPGVDGDGVAGQRYKATVTFVNTSDVRMTGIPVGAFNNGYRAILKDPSEKEITEIDLGPGESMTCTFEYTAQEGSSILTAVIDTPPIENKYKEETEEDNTAEVEVITGNGASNGGNGQLTFQAVSQDGSISRAAGTAKWTDKVTATLKPPAPNPPKGTLKSWSITSASLTYPKKNPDFVFGNPLPAQGTVKVNMNPEGHTATVAFQENWAMDGAQIFNPITQELMAENPKKYTGTATYSIHYTYEWKEKRRRCSGSGKHRHCHTYYVTKTGSGSTSGTATGELKVDGTGVNSRAQ